MKESVLPLSRSESSGSNDSIYSFSQDSVSTSPLPPPVAASSVHMTGASIVYDDSKIPPKLFPKLMRSSTRATVKELLWNLYMTFPFMIIAIFGILICVERYGQSTSYVNNILYRPNLPSSFESTGNFDNLNVEFYDLNDYKESANGWQHEERILYCVPLRDASQHLPMFFGHLKNLTYPHNLIDLAFLISDTTDSTIKDLKKFLKEIQADPNVDNRFGRINIYEKNFGQVVGQTFSDRHGFALQGPRRKLMAIARNWLLSTALRPDHSWVYWRDIDVETCPGTIIEDLMHHDKDVIVPNVWRPLPDWLDYEQPYDLNSWQESEGGIELLDRLDEDAVIVEGYSEYATWRPHLAYLRDPNGDPEVEMELDGIGGVSILVKASVFKSGAHFPAFSFQKHAETEAFGKLCKYMGYSVVGLPHYTIWHIYEPSSDDLKHMEWMAKEEQMRFEKLKLQKFYDRTWKLAFDDVSKEWDDLKFNVFKNTDLTKFRKVEVDWNEVDEYLQDINDQTINYEHFITEKKEEVRNYDANDPAKFIYNKYSHKKSEIDLKFKLNEIDKQKNLIKTNDFMNYGINKGEDLFGSFPINPYLSGNNPKSMRFVKFKKNEIIKFDEPEEEAQNNNEEQNNDDNNNENKDDNNNEKSREESHNEELNEENRDKQVEDSESKNADDESTEKKLEDNSDTPLEEPEKDQPIDIKQEDQIEPPKEEQSKKSTDDIRQDAMAAVLLKQKLAKQEKEDLDKKEMLESIQKPQLAKIDPESIKIDNEKKQKEKVLAQQQEINALALNKKKEESDNAVNLNLNSNKKSVHDKEDDLTDAEKLAKTQEEVELRNSISDEKILNKLKNYQNDVVNPRKKTDSSGLNEEVPDMRSASNKLAQRELDQETKRNKLLDDEIPVLKSNKDIDIEPQLMKSKEDLNDVKAPKKDSLKSNNLLVEEDDELPLENPKKAVKDEVKSSKNLQDELKSNKLLDDDDELPLEKPQKAIGKDETKSSPNKLQDELKSNKLLEDDDELPLEKSKKAIGKDEPLDDDTKILSKPVKVDPKLQIPSPDQQRISNLDALELGDTPAGGISGGLTDNINIGGSKEKLAQVDNLKDDIIIPKRVNSNARKEPLLE